MSKYTDEEWNEIHQEIENERKLGKPEKYYISIFVDSLTKDQLIDLKNKLIECNIPNHQLWDIDYWIKYRENKERESNTTNK